MAKGRITMKAVMNTEYGAIEALRTRDIDVPRAAEGEVLVRVHAAGLHIGDVFTVRGAPFIARLATGLRRPRYGVPGFDLAGTVESVGPRAGRFKVGDEVFGAGIGTCAQYARAAERNLVRKPLALTFEQAASIPTSALAALHGLRDAGQLRSGQRVLINGASGGVGTFAVQIAKAFGAEVTGVCGTANVEMVRSLGADRVIDYTRDDFTAEGSRYDLIFDNIENRAPDEVRRALTSDGVLVLNSGTGPQGLRMIARLIWPLVVSVFSRQKMRRYLSMPNQADLEWLAQLVEQGKLRPVIDSTYPLAETSSALRRIASGRSRGKVVVAIA